MAERAAHLVDHVFPDVPVRQWVLSLPYRLCYRLAWDHDLCRAVVAVYMRAVLGWLRRRAQLDDVGDGRGGAVAVLQRFGGALNLNVHIHALVLDGVFAKDRNRAVLFHPMPSLSALDVAEVLATVEPRIARLLDRRGIGDRDDSAGESDGWTDEAPVLAGLAAASVQGRAAQDGLQVTGRSPVNCARCMTRRALLSKGSRRCSTQRLFQITVSATRQWWAMAKRGSAACCQITSRSAPLSATARGGSQGRVTGLLFTFDPRSCFLVS